MRKLKLLLLYITFACLGINSMQAQSFDKALVKKMTLEKTKDLGHYISTIGNKGFQRKYKLEAIRAASNLFVSENNIVQVSSLNSDAIRTYTIRKYLNKLLVLKYAKVEITWYNINIISDFKKGPDGDYYAVVRIYQRFTGYDAEGNMIYTDETTKDINVKLTQLKIPTDNGREVELQVFLGDIKVEETKK